MPCLPISLTSSIVSSTSVGSSGCCRAITLSLIDGETLAQRADAAPNIGFDIGVAMLAPFDAACGVAQDMLVAQRFQNISYHVADRLELGDSEAARRACGRSDADRQSVV